MMYAVNLALVLFLVFANAFFVVSEFAIVKIRRTKLEELAHAGKSQAKIALKITEHLNTYLSAIQLGITLASLGLGWIGEPAVSRLLEMWFAGFFNGNTILLHSVSFGVAFAFITLLHVVLGELVPKSLAIQHTEKYVLSVARPLYLFNKVFAPFIWVFDHVTNGILRLMGTRVSNENDDAHSEEEIKLIIDASQKDGVIDDTEGEIIQNAIDFSEIYAHEIMIPRQDMKCLYLDDSYEEIMELVRANKHTRYPLCKDDKDCVVGMIHIRDLLEHWEEMHDKDILSKISRNILFVPENKSILEELVGDIMDEHDDMEEEPMKILSENVCQFDGTYLIEDAYECMKLPEIEYEESTIGGYVFGLLGREPKVSDRVEDDYCIYEVIGVDNMRITKVKAQVKSHNSDENADEESA